MQHSEDIYWLLLTYESKLKPKTIRGIISRCYDTLKISLEEFYHLPESTLSTDFELSPEDIQGIQQSHTLAAGQAFLLESLHDNNVQILKSIDPDYPAKLKTCIPDNYPPLLFCLGNISMFDKHIIAMIGQRDAHPDSLDFIHKSAGYFAHEHIVTISGFAKGIDQEAYLGTIEGGGQTIVILAEGILSAKSAFRKIASAIEEGQVTVVSQFHPNCNWQTWCAMARNQVVVGLADVTLVGQTKHEGGTWNGANSAIKLRKPLFVFMNPQTDLTGPKLLLTKGANPIEPNTAPELPTLLEPVFEALTNQDKYTQRIPPNKKDITPPPSQQLSLIPDSDIALKPKKTRKKRSP